MTTKLNEFDDTVGAAFEPNPTTAEMPLAGLEITTDASQDGSIAIGDPVSNVADPKSVTIYANGITPVSYDGESAIAAFDVVFSVGCVCPDTGRTSTYQVVKRIGVDKMKMANDAKMTTPVSIVEAQQEKLLFGMTAARFKTIAGL